MSLNVDHQLLAHTLRRLIERKLTTAKELAEVTGTSNSTVYRWIAGESQPTFNDVRLMFHHINDPNVQEALLSVFTAGTAWHGRRSDLDPDVNADGRVDCADALDASVETVRFAAESLAELRDAAREDQITAKQCEAVLATLNNVVAHCTLTEVVLVKMTEQRRKRKLRLAD